MKAARPYFRLPLPRAGRFDRFLKRRYVRTGEMRLSRERIFILPTAYGLVFALAIVVMLMGALNYNNSLAFMLTFLLGGVGLIATFHTYKNVSELVVQPLRATPTFAGQPARFTVMVDNRNGPPRFAVAIKVHPRHPVLVDLDADSMTPVEVSVPTKQRGTVPLGIVTVETRFPLGIYHAWSYVKSDMHCLVYPAPTTPGRLPLPSADERGGQTSRPQPGTDDFLGFRNYHAGDSTRHIYWKGLARGQDLLTKQFSRPQSQELWLSWESTPGADTEQKLSHLCRWVLDAHDAHLRFGLRLPGTLIPPGSGEGHKHRCLEALALFEAA